MAVSTGSGRRSLSAMAVRVGVAGVDLAVQRSFFVIFIRFHQVVSSAIRSGGSTFFNSGVVIVL